MAIPLNNIRRGFELFFLFHDLFVLDPLIKRGKLTREQIEKVAHKNAITRAVGVYERVDVDTLMLELKPDALVAVRCGEVTLTEGRMGKVGDRVAVRVAKPLRRPRTTFAMFEKADEPTNRMEVP